MHPSTLCARRSTAGRPQTAASCAPFRRRYPSGRNKFCRRGQCRCRCPCRESRAQCSPFPWPRRPSLLPAQRSLRRCPPAQERENILSAYLPAADPSSPYCSCGTPRRFSRRRCLERPRLCRRSLPPECPLAPAPCSPPAPWWRSPAPQAAAPRWARWYTR